MSAILLNLSWPPHQSTFLVFIGLVPVLYLHRAQQLNPSEYFFLAWLSFFLFHIQASWWMYSSTVAGSLMAHLINSFCMAGVLFLWSVMDRSLKAKPALSFFIFFSFWISFEWLHHHWDIAWPWFTLGNVFSDRTSWIQWYSYTGVLGGSLWILSVNFMITELVVKFTRKKFVIGSQWGVVAVLFAVVPLLISGLMPELPKVKQSFKILIVQPDIDPVAEKFDLMTEEQQIEKAIGLIEKTDLQYIHLVVLPETLITKAIDEDSLNQSVSIRRLRETILNRSDAALVVGSYTQKPAVSEKASVFEESGNAVVLFNSALYINKDTILVYHKSKLLPLVEKQPFRQIMRPFQDLIERSGGFFGSYGTSQAALTFPLTDSTKLIPVICFESVFGHLTRNRNDQFPSILVTLTNDGWWSSSGGYLQHLHYARLRSIENRLWTIRAANTGVSAIIDAKGNIINQTEYGVPETLVAEVPVVKQQTFYNQYGDITGIISFFSLLLLLIFYISSNLVNKRFFIKNFSK